MNKKPKIAVIGVKGLPAIGGAARSNESLIKYLAPDYHFTIYEISTHKTREMPDTGYSSVVFKGSKNKRMNTLLYYIKSCLHALFVGKYDLIHTQHLYSGFITPFLKIKYKVINTVRGIIPADDNKWNGLDKMLFRLFEKISLRYSDISVSVSKPQIPYLQQFTDKKVLFIPNGVDVSEDYLEEREKKQKDEMVFSAARIIRLKGCHILLKALHKISYNGKIKIIGSLEHVAGYKKEIMELAQGLDVKFTGLKTERSSLYHELITAKYFVFPSTKEGLSNMLLEVASLKIPIICSDIEENRAVFEESEVLYFKSGNYEDLAEKLLFAQRNPVVMQEKAENAFKRIVYDYNWKNVSHQYSNLYSSLFHTNING